MPKVILGRVPTNGVIVMGRASTAPYNPNEENQFRSDVEKGFLKIQPVSFDGLAPLASPAFTGNPTAPTPSPGDNDTSVSTTAFVTAAVTAAITGLAPLASPAFTGHPTGVTESALNNSTRLATTAYTDAAVGVETSARTTADALKANLASPTFTGTPSLPTGTTGTTQTLGDSSTKLATTAFVAAAIPMAQYRDFLSSAFSNATTSFTSTSLTFAIGAFESWMIELEGICTGAASGLVVRAAGSGTYFYTFTQFAASSSGTAFASDTASSGDPAARCVGSTGYMKQSWNLVKDSTSGTVTIQMKSGSASSSNMAKGFAIRAWRIA